MTNPWESNRRSFLLLQSMPGAGLFEISAETSMTITTPSLHPYINQDRPLLGSRTPGVSVLTLRPHFITDMWTPCELDRDVRIVRGLGLSSSSEVDQSRIFMEASHSQWQGSSFV